MKEFKLRHSLTKPAWLVLEKNGIAWSSIAEFPYDPTSEKSRGESYEMANNCKDSLNQKVSKETRKPITLNNIREDWFRAFALNQSGIDVERFGVWDVVKPSIKRKLNFPDHIKGIFIGTPPNSEELESAEKAMSRMRMNSFEFKEEDKGKITPTKYVEETTTFSPRCECKFCGQIFIQKNLKSEKDFSVFGHIASIDYDEKSDETSIRLIAYGPYRETSPNLFTAKDKRYKVVLQNAKHHTENEQDNSSRPVSQ